MSCFNQIYILRTRFFFLSSGIHLTKVIPTYIKRSLFFGPWEFYWNRLDSMSFPNLAVYNNEFWLYFFLVGKGCPSCLTYLNSIGWVTWAIQAAMKKLQAQATNFCLPPPLQNLTKNKWKKIIYMNIKYHVCALLISHIYKQRDHNPSYRGWGLVSLGHFPSLILMSGYCHGNLFWGSLTQLPKMATEAGLVWCPCDKEDKGRMMGRWWERGKG